MRRVIQLPVTMGIAKRKADSSVTIPFTTNYEVATEDFVDLDTYRNSPGYLLFAENELNEADIPKEDAKTDIKSRSQRLRAVLFARHKQEGGTDADFEPRYNRYMDAIIEQQKQYLS